MSLAIRLYRYGRFISATAERFLLVGAIVVYASTEAVPVSRSLGLVRFNIRIFFGTIGRIQSAAIVCVAHHIAWYRRVSRIRAAVTNDQVRPQP